MNIEHRFEVPILKGFTKFISHFISAQEGKSERKRHLMSLYVMNPTLKKISIKPTYI